jgi:hypothetical protein
MEPKKLKIKFLRKKGSVAEGTVQLIDEERGLQLIEQKVAVLVEEKPKKSNVNKIKE